MTKWPDLPYDEWDATRETLHMWLQIVGKIRLAKTKWMNHSWHVPLYVTARGLTTSVIHDTEFSFSIELDFIDHSLSILRSDGRTSTFMLQNESVAAFHDRCFAAFAELGIQPNIHEIPNEVPEVIPFNKDVKHCQYDREYAHRFWLALLHSDQVMKEFRADFIGKASPVHFFWGSNDLAVTRFSGRRAPQHPGGFPHLPDLVSREAYSHEVSSCGFWPGNAQFPHAAFYSYAYPMPEGFQDINLRPGAAFFHDTMGEFILPYEDVRESTDPRAMLLEFFQSTYEGAAILGDWDRRSLEESPYLEALQLNR